MELIELKHKPKILNNLECTYGIYFKGGDLCLYVGETLNSYERLLGHRKPSASVLYKLSGGDREKALKIRDQLEMRVLSYYAEDERMYIKKLNPILNVNKYPNKRIDTYNSKYKNMSWFERIIAQYKLYKKFG